MYKKIVKCWNCKMNTINKYNKYVNTNFIQTKIWKLKFVYLIIVRS